MQMRKKNFQLRKLIETTKQYKIKTKINEYFTQMTKIWLRYFQYREFIGEYYRLVLLMI
jgi:hypothetical protein